MKDRRPAIKPLGTVRRDEQGHIMIPYSAGWLSLPDKDGEKQLHEPVRLGAFDNKAWLFRNRILAVEEGGGLTDEELLLHIKLYVYHAEGKRRRVERQVEAFENAERVPSAKRESMPESVRLFVWRRDEGKCVKCGSQEKLEFDHIIPVADGGSNTERNIQLLCEQCNRQKGKSIS